MGPEGPYVGPRRPKGPYVGLPSPCLPAPGQVCGRAAGRGHNGFGIGVCAGAVVVHKQAEVDVVRCGHEIRRAVVVSDQRTSLSDHPRSEIEREKEVGQYGVCIDTHVIFII